MIHLFRNHPFDQRFSMGRFADLIERVVGESDSDFLSHQPKSWLSTKCRKRRRIFQLATRWEKLAFQKKQNLLKFGKGDLVHILDQGNARWALSLRNVPVLITCHDLHALDRQRNLQNQPKWLHRALLAKMKSGLIKAELIVTVSEFTKTRCLAHFPRKESSIRVIPLCLSGDFQQSSIPNCTLAAINPKLRTQNYIISVGATYPRKRLGMVLQTLKLIPQNQIPFVVFAGNNLNRGLRQLRDQLSLDERVICIPDLDDSKLRVLYNGALALFFPSGYEGFGWPILEAQACDCPVICSRRSALPEVAGGSALFPSHDTATGYAELMKSLLASKQLRSDFVNRGNKNLQRFTFPRFSTQYQACYRLLSSNRRNRSPLSSKTG